MLALKPWQVTRAGIARTFQNVRLFRQMSVLENVMSGQHCRTSAGAIGAILRPPAQRREEQHIREVASACLRFVGIDPEEWGRDATTLAYGHQRRVEIARALATEPKLLLLDEPAAGLSHEESTRMMDLVATEVRNRCTVVLVEHNMRIVGRYCDRAVVLQFGRTIYDGRADGLVHDARVVDAYLGVAEMD